MYYINTISMRFAPCFAPPCRKGEKAWTHDVGIPLSNAWSEAIFNQSVSYRYMSIISRHPIAGFIYFDHVTWRNEKLYLALPSLCAFLRAWRCKKCFLWQNKQRNFSYSLKITDSNSGRRSNRNHATWLWKPRGHKNILISLINSN